MGAFPQSFEVYGFTIEVHAGGRRVWSPSFKRFVKEKLDKGELTLTDIMKTCNVSQSLVYKWRADIKTSRIRSTTATEETFFSEVIVKEERAKDDAAPVRQDQIHICGRAFSLSLPATYPAEDVVKIILAVEGHA